ncbi:DENN domain-containing protein 2A-like isoform X2 [Dreissena polymorpha]|uniref:DENN domain-containing protein 2A-like isoform X2 n=1 Tax=Dreissena polymorpha TaxID=45954 RepID=UPI002263F17D|nr:DENN domain-containing protein 2A-like isoform X2 [Dreissena polymorpha]
MSFPWQQKLPHGSVRSLPKGKLQQYKQFFDSLERNNSNSSDVSIGNRSPSHSSNGSLDTDSDKNNEREDIRNSEEDLEPRSSDIENLSKFPTPSPRNSLKKKTDEDMEKQSASELHEKFEQISDRKNIVSNIRSRFEDNAASACVTQPVKRSDVNIKPRIPSPRRVSPRARNDNEQSGKDTSPECVKRQNPASNIDSEHVYSRIWAAGDKKEIGKQNNVPRPITVSERAKLFQSEGNSTKPTRPPPPLRQKSNSEDETSSNPDSHDKKVPPPRPPFRIRPNTDDHPIEDDSASPKKLPPPSKPRRTGAHDEYIKVKLEKEACEQKVIVDEDHGVCDTSAKVNSVGLESVSVPKRQKPTRPPPLLKKQLRPFSIATDNFIDFKKSMEKGSSSEEEELRPDTTGDLFFDESAPSSKVEATLGTNELIKHWDLPRISHPEPKILRRSRSADIVQKAVDDDGEVVYMDPEALHLNDKSQPGYDIYLDPEGYAVPNRLVKRKTSSGSDDIDVSRPIGDRFKSKIRKFKNLFSEQDKPSKSPPPIKSQGSQRRRIELIRKKVNQAFEVLQSSLRPKEADDTIQTQTETQSNDSDSRVDEKEIRKRVEYSRSVRYKTQKNFVESRRLAKKVYPQMFEHAIIVSLNYNETKQKYEPYIVYKFPEIRNYRLTMEGKLFPCSEAKDSNVSVPLFCFPDAANFKPSSSSMTKSQSYNFVLTNFDGGRVYGYCRRFVPPKSAERIPEVICIMSPVDAFTMYNELLMHIEEKRAISLHSAQELIAATFGRPLPQPGQTETIRTLDVEGEMETLFLTRDADNRFDNANVDCLLTHLGVDKLLKVFASILLERSVLFCAKHLSALSSTIHAIVSLLYPFSWQHTFIPLLPSDMIEVICSPTPFIIGITSSLINKAQELPLEENVLIFDIDKKEFRQSLGDEGTLLPKKIEKALKSSLNMCRVDAEAKSSPNLMISEAFLRFFVEAVGHYGQFIVTQSDGTKSFQKDNFVKGAQTSGLQQLLEWFVETQMFEVFLTRQLESKHWGNTIEVFQTRIQEHMAANQAVKRRLVKKS